MVKFWLENEEVKSDEPLNKFDDDQMEEIRLGLEAGLDVSVYADIKYNYMQMRMITFRTQTSDRQSRSGVPETGSADVAGFMGFHKKRLRQEASSFL